MNLIINAAEAGDEHNGRVIVSTGVERLSAWKVADMTFGRDVKPGTYAFLDVRDNGPGMDAATLEKIFNPFFTTKQSGHGLGLAAVQGWCTAIVEHSMSTATRARERDSGLGFRRGDDGFHGLRSAIPRNASRVDRPANWFYSALRPIVTIMSV